jgi:monofunctional biosynthetic peptidoglycan transglycosylase
VWRRWALAALAAGAVWLFGTWPPPVWWRTHWPERTAMMRWTAGRLGGSAGVGAGYRPVALDSIAAALPRLVVIAEDSRFRTHWGIDPAEIADAAGVRPGASAGEALRALWRRRDRVRGASTITQQLAKNLYLSPSRNPLRKVKEIATALRLEAALSKDRILELYLNVAELGAGVWGVDEASRTYFARAPGQLSLEQAASLAATLPFPRRSNPGYMPGRMLARRRLVLARYYGADVVIPPVDELGLDTLLLVPVIDLPVIPPTLDSVLDTVVVPAPDTAAPPPDAMAPVSPDSGPPRDTTVAR